MELLVNAGVDITVVDEDLNTPLHYAAEFGHRDVVDLLLRNDAPYEKMNKFGNTPADIAMNIDIVKTFKKYIDVDEVKRDSYVRQEYQNVLRHNSRMDYVNKVMFARAKDLDKRGSIMNTYV